MSLETVLRNGETIIYDTLDNSLFDNFPDTLTSFLTGIFFFPLIFLVQMQKNYAILNILCPYAKSS